MAGNPLHTVLDHLRRLHSVSNAAQRTDRELLRAFARNNDQDAFAIVVTRHAPLVWGVCRRILGHHHDAEDAFQATFLILARRAGSTRWQASVGGWLHMVAQRLAVRARKQAEQRRIQEREATRTPPGDSSLRELAAVVDEELRRLPVKYREPLLLHYLEGATAEAAARQLGLSRTTFYNRLAHGRELLRERLSRQGLSLTAPLLAAALTAEAEAASQPLIQATTRGVMGNVSEPVAAMAAEMLGRTAMMKLKISLVLGLLLGFSAGGVAMLTAPAPMDAVPQAERPAEPSKAEDKAAVRVDRYGDPLPPGAIARLGTFRFRVDSNYVEELAFTPDGKQIAVATLNNLQLLDAATGKRTKLLRSPYTFQFRHIAFSADGKRLMTVAEPQISGSPKEVVQIWDVPGGRKISELELEKVCWLGWSAEGQPLAVCLDKGEIILHEPATGRKRRFRAKDFPDSYGFNGRLGGALANFHCVAGKNILIAGDQKGVIHVWNLASGAEQWLLKTGGVLTGGIFVHSLALSPDGRWLASLSRHDGNKDVVQLWDLTTGKAAHVVAAGQTYLHGIAFTPDSKSLATVGWKEVRFWDTANGRELACTKGEGRLFAASVSFTPDSKTMAAAEMYCGTLHLWDVASGERKPEPEGHAATWLGILPAFSPDGKRIATSGQVDGTLRIWDAATGRQLVEIRRSPRSAIGCAFAADGRSLFSCWDDKVIITDAANGGELHVLNLNDSDRLKVRQQGEGMYLSGDCRSLIAFSRGDTPASFNDRLLTVWNTTTRKQLFRRGLASSINVVWLAVSLDARLLASADAEPSEGPGGARILGQGPIYVEDLKTGERLLTFPALKGQTAPLAFSPDARLLISSTFVPAAPAAAPDKSGETLRVWEVLTASEVLALPYSGYLGAKAAVSPDSRLLAAIAPLGEIFLWDLRRGKELRRFKNSDAHVISLAFSPDGRRLVSGLSDSTLLVWDVGAPPAARVEEFGEDGAAKAWADLAATEAPRAFRARGILASAPETTIPLLKKHLHPANVVDPQRLRRLLADLDSNQFDVREEAQAELAKLGDLAEPALRQTLANNPSLEMRQRVQAILERLRDPVTQPELLQALRAVAVLEDMGTPEARRLLKELTKGAPVSRLTREAKASLERLTARRPMEKR